MASMDKIFSSYAKRRAALTVSSNAFANGIAWIDGQTVPLAEARIPMMDQGFLHSDLTYDVASVWDGKFFRLDEHLDRIEASCTKSRLKLPLPKEDIKSILISMVAQSGIRDAYVMPIVTRGLKGVRGARAEDLVNKLFMLVQPYVWVMEPEVQRSGGSAVIARTVRRTPPGSMDPTVKNLQWGDFTRGMFEASDRGAMYPFLTDGDGNLTEGSGYNIVLIKDGVVYTPDRGVLEGVTRKSVLEVARAKGFEVRVEIVPVKMAFQCDEMFMCTTAGGVMPITSLDGKNVKDGKIGPMTKAIWDGYWQLHYDPKHTCDVRYDGVEQNANGSRARL